MRRLSVGLALLVAACGMSEGDIALEVRRAALQELVTKLEAPSYPWAAACIALDSAWSVDGVHQPPDGFTASLRSSRLELRRFGTCVKNPGLPGFTWRDTTAAARAEVLLGFVRVESIGEDRAVVDVLWMAGGLEGEEYRCEVIRDGAVWIVEKCDLAGMM